MIELFVYLLAAMSVVLVLAGVAVAAALILKYTEQPPVEAKPAVHEKPVVFDEALKTELERTGA